MSDAWTLVYEAYDPEEEGRREALCTLGNGRFATRGAAAEASADGVHYPGTYLAGGYNRLESEIAGRTIVNEDLVNLPNWLPVTFRPERGEWVRWGRTEILEWRTELRMKEGGLVRRVRVRDAEGRETTIRERRLVHMGKPHLAALEYRVRPENWSGWLELVSSLDASVTNHGVARYRQLASKHLVMLDRGPAGRNTIQLHVRTSQSQLDVGLAARTKLLRGGEPLPEELEVEEGEETVAQRAALEVDAGEEVVLEKVVALYTSRDRAVSDPTNEARAAVRRAGDFETLLAGHRVEWDALWRRFDLELALSPDEARELARMQLILRLHIFHLLQTCSHNTIGMDVGVPARGWHGEAYRGHIFWDEIFIHPFFNLHLPEISRSLLLYRYHRLEAARAYARDEGYAGALFPWQSGSNGTEETQVVHLNPRSGEWGPDHSRLQRHINAAIAYNVWQYHQTTGDLPFLRRYGAEMLLEIARFWGSIASFGDERGRWEIRGVMGPDEYQEMYPGAEAGGVNNNAYTNVMAVWCLERALEVLATVGEPRAGELRERLDLTEEELERWRSITERMFVPFLADGVIEQFEGYGDLDEFDWEGYRRKYGDIQRLDRILGAEGDTTDRYKASKQADATMLFYLLPAGVLERLLGKLGYPFDQEAMRRTVEYYRKRSSHGSTLSWVVYASVLNVIDQEEGWRLFREALRADIDDIQGGTTAEGIHLGAMAGTVDIVLRRYAGIDVSRSEVRFDPNLPPRRSGMCVRIEHRNQWIEVRVEPGCLRLTLEETAPDSVLVRVCGRSAKLQPGATRVFELGS